MVISSSSKGLTSGARVEVASSRAPARAGSNAAVIPPKTLVCKNLLRCGELGNKLFGLFTYIVSL